MGSSILLVDDDESVYQTILGVFSSDPSLSIIYAKDGSEGLINLQEKNPDVCIVDYNMPGITGLEFIKKAQCLHPNIPIIALTAYGNTNLNVDFLKAGAFRYIEKPFDIDEFKITIGDALSTVHLKKEHQQFQSIVTLHSDISEIVGNSPVMKTLFELISKVSSTDLTVLIEGESGTGKELVASAIHERSNRSRRPFIRFNCAAIPETLIESELFGYEKGAFTSADQKKLGRFELAHNGTLFIDEIGELDISLQVKLLRVLQEREFERIGGTVPIQTNVRVICATNRNLQDMVRKGLFRDDLYYRLNVFPIFVPPLRDRSTDIILLTHHFTKLLSKKYNKPSLKISPAALEILSSYTWKGNVRELENVISRATILCTSDTITPDLLHIDDTTFSSQIEQASSRQWTEDQLVKHYAQHVYNLCNGNKKKTAKFLNINYRTLIKRLSDIV